ncbi:MAG: hypothetical protein ACOYJ1_04725 [Peptococcales bacterium]|jgi:hypothetical protein
MSPKKRNSKRKENSSQNKFQKPDAKWYKSMKIWFGLFLGLVALRMLLFVVAQGKLRVDDIWFRFLLISFGTLVAWWYVNKRPKEK